MPHLPRESGRPGPSPRLLSPDLSPGTVGLDHYNWKYVADCDRPDDQAWFDNFWQTYNWSWHQYSRTNGYSTSSTTPPTEWVQTHVCNDGPSGTAVHRVARWNSGSSCGYLGNWSYVFTQNVPPEYRGQFRVSDDSGACGYSMRNTPTIGGPKPTYSWGITAP